MRDSSAGSRTVGRTSTTGRGTTATGRSAGSTLDAGARSNGFTGRGSRGSSTDQIPGTSATGRTGQNGFTGRGGSRSPGSDQVPGTSATGRGANGFRPSSDAAAAAGRRGATGRTVGAGETAGQAPGGDYRRYGYYPRSYSTYPNCGYGYPYGGYCYGYNYGWGSYYCSPYYASGGFYLSFAFGAGPYFGVSYYSPWYHCGTGASFGFFYGDPVSYCYVPYGFYCDATPTYVTRYVYVQDTYPATEYEAVEAKPPADAPKEGEKVVEPEPAASTPAAEKYLREASEQFRRAEYLEAARNFRLAALSAPENAAPLFALGQALLAIGSDAYAAKVIRKAVVMNPGLVKEPGDIVGVFKSQEEFDRVMLELLTRAEQSPAGSDARFLLAAERYFSGDPKAAEGFAALKLALPQDQAVALFATAAEKRFAVEKDLPPVVPEPK